MAYTSRFVPDPAAAAGLPPQDPWWRDALQRLGLEAAVLTSSAASVVRPSAPASQQSPWTQVSADALSATPGLSSPAPVDPSSALQARDALSLALARGSGEVGAGPAPEASVDLGAGDQGPIHFGRCTCPVCSGAARLPQGRSSGKTTTTSRTASTSAMPLVSLQTLADYLTTGYWQEAGTYTRKYNLTSSGYGAKNGVITYNLTGWATDANGLAADRQALAREVFKAYSATLGITFREVTGSGGDIRFTDNDTGAYAYMASGWYADSTKTKVNIDYSVVNVASNWYDGKANYDTYTPQTFFHEIGHALGLGHQGQYNYTGTPLSYSSSAQFVNDSWQATMMSYWDQSENTTTGASFAWLQTPMAVDWIALNDLYRGQGYSTDRAFQGNTIYGVGTNISASVSQIWNQFSTYAGVDAYTLADGSGYDTLDVSNFAADQLINLAPSQPGSTAPSVSNIGGKIGNLTIAAGTVIEAANGGSGNDSFYGNAAANTFHGNGGNDSFYDSLGSDIYYGDAGNDSLYFSDSINLLSYTLSGDSLLFSRRSGSADVDQVWNGLENLSFNGVVYTYDQLVASLSTNPSLPPTGTLTLTNVTGGSVNEGSNVTVGIATTNLASGASVYWQLSGAGINTRDFVGLSSLTGSVATDGSGNATLNLSIRADATTEGSEQLGVALFSDAALTNKLADAAVTIQDTSLTPTGTLTLTNVTGGSVNEGSNVTVGIATANLASGASVYWQLSGAGINTSDFVGLSSLTGSVATDGSGNATLNLSIRADATTEGSEQLGVALFSDAALTNKLADAAVTIQDTSLTPVVSNLTLWGTTASDVISGGAGNDRITGVLATGSTTAAMGGGQIDRLTGLAGADVFVLGDSRGVFYDDRLSGNPGSSDYARITDFRSSEDKVQLRSGRYLTTTANGNLSLYWDRNNTGRIEVSGSSCDELIAIFEGVTGLSSTNIVWA